MTSQTQLTRDTANYVIVALYKFVTLDDYQELRETLLEMLKSNEILGTLILASEGINGTVGGSRDAIDLLLKFLTDDPRFEDLVWKESYFDDPPFRKTKVKAKAEIVTMGIDGVDPNAEVGTYVEPKDWNEIISDPEMLVIDCRNDYEFEVGSFENAVNPNTEAFRDFPTYVEENLDPTVHKKVAMFCTGGIRCEKSTSFLKQRGFENVYHLKGGILKYLEEIEAENSMWNGECYVFDRRVTVVDGVLPGSYAMCFQCGYPVSKVDQQSEHYVIGVSCPRCINLSPKSPESLEVEEQLSEVAVSEEA